MCCPETKHITLLNISEERKSPLRRGGNFMLNKPVNYLAYDMVTDGFGGLGVACWLLVPKFVV
jgi:hypothetical protein